MTKKLSDALDSVETTYKELVDIANDMLYPIITPVNDLVDEVSLHINALSIDQIRDFILRLQLKAFEISDVKEKSLLKAQVAEAVQRERFATEFTGADGTAAAKDKLATIATAPEAVTDALYSLIAGLLKNKVDQLHRLVDALKSILMSRMQEAKFMNIGATGEIPPTTGESYRTGETKRF